MNCQKMRALGLYTYFDLVEFAEHLLEAFDARTAARFP